MLTFEQKLFLTESFAIKYVLYKKYKKNKRTASNVIYNDRLVFGEYYHLYPQLRENELSFRSYTRMSTKTFDYILEAITPEFDFQTTNFQEPISIEQRLLVTIRYVIHKYT